MKRMSKRFVNLGALLAMMLVCLLALAACGDDATPTATQRPPGSTATQAAPTATATRPAPTATATPQKLSGKVQIDGSSTVYPITEAMAEEFMKLHRDVQVTVGIAGTGGGFKRFCAGETDISDASRPISVSEIEVCKTAGIEYIELPMAFDGLSIMVNPQNTWVDKITVAELKKIWGPGSTVKKWSDVQPTWPNENIVLVGPGTDSGTFDYFTEVINGTAKASRADYIASEDDNVLVQAVADSQYALGYFGFAYYVENQGKLKLVPVDPGDGKAILPSDETINNGSYKPLSRPLLIYVNKKSLDKAEVREFVAYYLSGAGINLVAEVGYVKLPNTVYTLVNKRYQDRKTGTAYTGGTAGKTLEEIYKQ